MRPPVSLALALLLSPLAAAQAPFRSELVATGFTRPVYVGAPTGDPRLFVIEQTGRILVLKGGDVLAEPFLDLTGQLAPGGERGVLGLAFHPRYADNGHVYLNYTQLDGSTVVARYTADDEDPDRLDPASAVTVIGPIAQPNHIHNGGCLAFGPDGKLFVGMGDGGHSGDTGPGHAPEGNGQSLFTLHGKLLRLDVDLPYPHIPSDNPYVGTLGGLGPIWAHGFREPWRFSFDRATGDLYIGDVGGGQREEIDFVAYETWMVPEPPILNFGWRCQEGTVCTGLTGCRCGSEELIAPLEEFDHTVGRAVIGGYVYRGCAIPSLRGTYVYATFSYTDPSRVFGFTHEAGPRGRVKGPTVELTAAFEPDGPGSLGLITTFGEDGRGELHFCNLVQGEVYKVVPGGDADCNGNGVEDACDISNGTSLDLDRNGVPDECEGTPAPIGGARRSEPSRQRRPSPY